MVTSYIEHNENWFLKGSSDRPNEYIISNGLVNKVVKLKPLKKKELFIQCECQGEVLKIDKWEDDEEYYLTVFKYSSPSISVFSRIGYAWKVLFGRGIRTADLVISKENFNKIKKFK